MDQIRDIALPLVGLLLAGTIAYASPARPGERRTSLIKIEDQEILQASRSGQAQVKREADDVGSATFAETVDYCYRVLNSKSLPVAVIKCIAMDWAETRTTLHFTERDEYFNLSDLNKRADGAAMLLAGRYNVYDIKKRIVDAENLPEKSEAPVRAQVISEEDAIKLNHQISDAIPKERDLVKSRLIDPDSAKFRNIMAMQPTGFQGFIFCGEVNSKNRFGGYSGFTRFLAVGDTVDIVEDGSPYENVFQKFCQRARPLTPVTF